MEYEVNIDVANKAKKEMTFISRKIRFLLTTKMPGTRYLVL